MGKAADESNIELWRHYQRQPELFARLPVAWQRSIASHYTEAVKRQQLRQRRRALHISMLTALAAAAATKAKAAASYTTTLTGTASDTAYNSATDANGNLVYRFVNGDGIGVTASGAQDAYGVSLQSGTPKVVLQAGADGKGSLNVTTVRPAAGSFGNAFAIDVEAGGNLTVNGNTTATAQANDAVHWVVDHNEGGSEAQGVRLIQGTAVFNGDLNASVETPAYSRGLWIYQGHLTVNGHTTVVAKGRGANTAGIYNSGGGIGSVVFNGGLDVTGYGIWPSDNVHGVYNDGMNTKLTVIGDANISATSNGSTVMGVRNQGNFVITGNATVTADGPRSAFGVDNTHRTARFSVGGDLIVKVTNHGGYTPFGLPTAMSNMYGRGGSMTLGGAVDARISGVTESYAINNNGVMSFNNAGKRVLLRADVNCTACDVYGIANNGGSITMAGGLDVAVSDTGSGRRYAIWNAAVDGQDSVLNVNQAGGQSVLVDGDVVTRSLVNAAGTAFAGTTRLNFNDNASFLKGLVLGGSGTSGTSTYSAGIPVLAFSSGARWIPTGIGALNTDFGNGSLTLGTGGAIDLAAAWGSFVPGSLSTHSLRELRIDGAAATVNLADGATFTLLSDIRNAQADKVTFGSGIASFSAQGTQQVRIAYDPVLDDTSWVNATTLKNGTAIAATRPVAIVDASAAASGAAHFQAVGGLAGQWSTSYENALVRFSYVPQVQTSADGKTILLTGIDILGSSASTSGNTSGGASGTGDATPPQPATTGPVASPPVSAGNNPGTTPVNATLPAATVTATAIAPATGVLVAGDAMLALSNLWQIDERAVSRRSEARRLDDTPGGATFWADSDVDSMKGDSSDGRTYQQNATSASAGTEWRTELGQGLGVAGLVYTHAQSRADLQNGSADLRGNSVGMYGTWNASSGIFADAVARFGYLSDSYTSRDALGMTFGRYQARASSVAVRAGQRFQGGHGVYIEPQVQAAYGTIDPSAYSASNRVRFDVGRSHTVLTRAGVLLGKTFFLSTARTGDIYARVSMTRTMGNRPQMTASLDGGSLPVALPQRRATTREAIVGGRVAFTGTWSAFVEAGHGSRTDAIAGGWRAAVGISVNF
jgi:outer membrane autotransporter protein